VKQYEAVIEAMWRNGGFATFGWLYQHVPVAEWGTKTPFATIRRIVQDRPEFFKVKPGLWALEEARVAVAERFGLGPDATPQQQQYFDHTYYQGLLVETGNYHGYDTWIPAQDKNKMFLDRRLGDIATLPTFPAFTYEHVLDRARTVDVVWFNTRGYPHACYEVEHSTGFANSLDKYVELQDFVIDFCVVADAVNNRDYLSKAARASVVPIKNKVRFQSYEYTSDYHTTKAKEYALRQLLGIKP